MKKALNILSLILTLSLVFSFFSACGKNDQSDITQGQPSSALQDQTNKEQGDRVLKLPYSNTEPLNPYKATSLVNIQLAELIYDPLFHLSKDYKPLACIAEKYTFENLSIFLDLKKGLVFSDSSPLKAEDIIHSFGLAKKSDIYGARLSSFAGVKKLSDHSLVFSLNRSNPYAANCLTFPIIKNGGKDDTPIGSGRYRLVENKGKLELRANESRLGGFSPKQNKISLINIQDSKTLSFALQIGNIDFAYSDLSEGSYSRVNANSHAVPLNNLVFLTFNHSNALLRDPQVRKAIALLIDIQSISENSFQGHARPAYTPFNPDFYGGEKYKFQPDPKAAEKAFEAAGFTKSSAGRAAASNYSKLKFDLLVNADNPFKSDAAQKIAASLTSAGLAVNVTSLPFDQYIQAVKKGRFDIYIGEVALTADMDLSPLLKAGGALSYGIDTYAGGAALAYKSFLEDGLNIEAFCRAFSDDLPFLPLGYRNALALYSRALKTDKPCDMQDVFCKIEKWSF